MAMMASGRSHAKGSTVLSVIMLPLGFAVFGPEGAFISIGCLAGILVTPDLDIKHPTYSDTVVERIGSKAGCIFGSLARGLWRWFWLPYAYIIPRHRHWSSHAPVIGTLIRFGYLTVVTVAFCTLLPTLIGLPGFWLMLIGLGLSDILHWLMDI